MENRKKTRKDGWKKFIAAAVAIALIFCGAFGASYVWGLKDEQVSGSVLASISAPELSEFEDDVARAVFDMLKDQVAAEVSAQISLWSAANIDGNTNADMSAVTDYLARMLSAMRGDINSMVAAEIQNLDFTKLTDDQIAVISDRVAAMIADSLLTGDFASKFSGKLDVSELQALISSLTSQELNGLKSRLDDAESRINSMYSDYDALSSSISQITSRIESNSSRTDKTINELNSRVVSLTTKMDSQITDINGILDGKLNVTEFNTFLTEYRQYLGELDAVIKRVDDAEGRLDEAETAIKDAMDDIDTVREDLEALESEMTEKMEKETHETRSIIENLREATSSSIGVVEQKIKDLSSRVSNNEVRIQQLMDEQATYTLERQADGSYRLYIDDPRGPQ